jgi:hypothetical protein
MTTYDVNAAISFPAWLSVDAESPEDAQQIAEQASVSSFEYDASSGEVEFNVDPAVEIR